MGNAPSTQNPSSGKRRHGADPMSLSLSSSSHGGRNTLLAMSQGPPLNRRAGSFLDEPVELKNTERGEDAIRLPHSARCDRSVASAYRDPAPGAGRLRYAVSEMQGWRSHMEDEHLLSPPLSADPAAGRVNEVLEDHHLFAVFDGHGEYFHRERKGGGTWRAGCVESRPWHAHGGVLFGRGFSSKRVRSRVSSKNLMNGARSFGLVPADSPLPSTLPSLVH